MSKNVVVCCDGTGNQFGENNSNVVKLYTCLGGEEQATYYHPGVGTMGSPSQLSRVGKNVTRILGLAFGYGFRDNIADAYRFLMERYEPGDHIFLFGFSRGAYTVRALAGALSVFGLLCRGNEGHLPYLLKMYSDASRKAYNGPKPPLGQITETDESRAFRETFSRVVPIHFVGLWDTVSSVGWIYDPVKLIFDGRNPAMREGRHALSVDERRCFFQQNPWGEPLPPEETPVLRAHYADAKDQQQNIVQAWFAGVHSDVGGSFPQCESYPAMQPLLWILEEAIGAGLRIDERKRAVIFGQSNNPEFPGLVAKNKPAPPEDSLHLRFDWRWFPLEIFPHKYFDGEGNKRWRLVPWPHRRELPDGALLHPTLLARLGKDNAYRPPNLKRSRIVLTNSPNASETNPAPAQFGTYHPDLHRQRIVTSVKVLALAGLAVGTAFAVRSRQ